MSKPSAGSAAPALPELGVGMTYSAAVEPVLERHPDLFDVVEVEPQTSWLFTRDGPTPFRVLDSVLEHIAGLPGRKIVHSVGTPVGGTVRPDPAQVALLRQTIERLGCPWASDHLSFNATPEFHTGFFLPPRQTAEGVAAAVRSVRDLQAGLGVPVAVETGVNYLRPRPDEMPDGAFVAAVAEAADCGLLLDLHNVFANGLNGRQPADEFLTQLPLERVWEVHLAGGFELEGYWLDAHSGAIPDPLLELAKRVIPALPNLKAIIFEIFPSFVPSVGFDTIRAQVERMHELWVLRGQARGDRSVRGPLRAQVPTAPGGHPSPEVWERALGALAAGLPAAGDTADELALDRGVGLVQGLIREFRASMVVGVLGLTSRLLMLTLGPEVFRAVLADFWSKAPPQPFASAEAEAFADYLAALDLKVPQLAKVLEFDRAVVATLMDDRPRVVKFDVDPLPVFRALAEGRLTGVPVEPGEFEVEITPDGTVGVTGIDTEALRQGVRFH
jgi:uncharacterized protein